MWTSLNYRVRFCLLISSRLYTKIIKCNILVTWIQYLSVLSIYKTFNFASLYYFFAFYFQFYTFVCFPWVFYVLLRIMIIILSFILHRKITKQAKNLTHLHASVNWKQEVVGRGCVKNTSNSWATRSRNCCGLSVIAQGHSALPSNKIARRNSRFFGCVIGEAIRRETSAAPEPQPENKYYYIL